MVIEANRCFISALPFKTMLRIWRQLLVVITQSVLANALTCALPIAVQVGLIAANKHRKGAKYSEPSRFFLSHPPSCPNLLAVQAGHRQG